MGQLMKCLPYKHKRYPDHSLSVREGTVKPLNWTEKFNKGVELLNCLSAYRERWSGEKAPSDLRRQVAAKEEEQAKTVWGLA